MLLMFLAALSGAILVVWYSSLQINKKIKSLQSDNSYYTKLETDLVNAAGLFLNDNPMNECSLIGCTINYEILKTNNYIGRLIDEKDRSECDGYVKVINDVFQPYISCSNYKTGEK